VGLSRVINKQYYVTDVIAGGAIGYFLASYFTSPEHKNIIFMPNVGRKSVSVQVEIAL